jgi:hypothetical protein
MGKKLPSGIGNIIRLSRAKRHCNTNSIAADQDMNLMILWMELDKLRLLGSLGLKLAIEQV